MNEQKQERTIVIDINLTQRMVVVLILVLLAVAFVGYLVLGQEPAAAGSAVPKAPQALAASSSGLRKFYRTADAYSSTLASTACIAGYHFASMWELLDPSNLEYAGDLDEAWGGSGYDMGEGPVTGAGGFALQAWVRTGYNADVSGFAGRANCNNWTSDDGSDYGTLAGITHEWGVVEDISIWNVGVGLCNVRVGVWCVED